MAEWYVSTDVLRDCSAQVVQCGADIENVSAAVNAITRGIRYNSASMALCRAKLNVLMRDMRIEAMQVEHMASAMESITGRYQSAESGLRDPQLAHKTFAMPTAGSAGAVASWAVEAATDTGAEEKKITDPFWKSLLDKGMKIATSIFGPAGTTVMGIYDFFVNGKDPTKSIISLCGKEISTGMKKDAKWTDYIFGNLTKVKDGQDIIDDALNKYNPLVKAADGTVDKAASTAGLFSLIATLVGQGVENYNEQGEINARWCEETITESALTIGKDIVIGAAVGGVAVALGVSAPAWATAVAVAAIGIGVDFVGNWIARKVTGDENAKWLESASDFVCDNVVEPVISAVGDAVEATKQGARWIGDTVGRAVQNFFGSRCAWAGGGGSW